MISMKFNQKFIEIRFYGLNRKHILRIHSNSIQKYKINLFLVKKNSINK